MFLSGGYVSRLSGIRQWLNKAFSMEAFRKPLDDDEKALLDRIARTVVKRRMTVPAIMALEMGRPLNYVGSQAMAFFEPIVKSLFTLSEYSRLKEILERRESIEMLIHRIESLNAAGLDNEGNSENESGGEPGEPADTFESEEEREG